MSTQVATVTLCTSNANRIVKEATKITTWFSVASPDNVTSHVFLRNNKPEGHVLHV